MKNDREKIEFELEKFMIVILKRKTLLKKLTINQYIRDLIMKDISDEEFRAGVKEYDYMKGFK